MFDAKSHSYIPAGTELVKDSNGNLLISSSSSLLLGQEVSGDKISDGSLGLDTFSDKGFIPKGTSVSVDASGKYYVPPLTGFIPAREVSIANAQKGSLSQDSFDVTTGSFIPSGTSVYKLGSKYYVHPDTKDTPGREISGLGLSGSHLSLSKDVFDAKTRGVYPSRNRSL